MTLDKIPVGEICGVTGMDLPRQVDPLCRGAGHHPENRGGLRWENN